MPGPGNATSTVPGEIDGAQFPPVLYNTPLAGLIATLAATNLVTAPATGTYRLTLAASQSVLGVGSPGATTFTVSAVFTDPFGAGASTQAMAAFTTAAVNGVVGYIAAASGISTLLFRAKVGTAIQVSVAVTGGGGTTNPTVIVIPILESLGQ